MFSPSTEYPESRPFKMFISLLDKWEIGGPLSEAIILDAFKALRSLIESNTTSSEDVSVCISRLLPCVRVTIQAVMTASMLYEAVEPHIVWRQLLTAVLNELSGHGSQNEVRMASFRIASDTHSSIDIGSPFGSLHPEDHTCPRRRDSGRSLTNCILSPLRSLAGWHTFQSPEPRLTALHVRFRSHVIQREGPYQWRQTFCDFSMHLKMKFLHLHSSNFLRLIHCQLPMAH
jgi:hypothetical protein